jgi:hypothetical protein
MRPLTITGKENAQRVLLAVVGFLFQHLGQHVHGERHAVGDELAIARGDGIHPRGLTFGVLGDFAGR